MAVDRSATASRRVGLTEYVNVLVGPTEKSIVVHKDLISLRSPLSKAALAKCWNENDASGVTKLPIDDPEAFADYLQYVYGMTDLIKEVQDNYFSRCVEAYVLADKFGDLDAANAIVDDMIRASDEGDTMPCAKPIEKVFEQTSDISPLRRLMVDFWILHGDSSLLVYPKLGDPPVAFLRACLKENWRRRYRVDPSTFHLSKSTIVTGKCSARA